MSELTPKQCEGLQTFEALLTRETIRIKKENKGLAMGHVRFEAMKVATVLYVELMMQQKEKDNGRNKGTGSKTKRSTTNGSK